MGTRSVRVDEALYDVASVVAKANTRSTNQQIEHWAKLGKIGEANPNLRIAEIQSLLISTAQVEQGQTSEYIFGEGDEN